MFHRLSQLTRYIFQRGLGGASLRSKQRSLLRILSVSHSEQLNPAQLVQNLAAEYPGSYGRKLHRLQRWIAAESSMSAAIAHSPGALCDDDALAIQCGIETKSLDQTFAFLHDHRETNDHSDSSNIARNSLGYVIALLIFFVLATTFLMVFVIPTLNVMFDELGWKIPAPMSALIEFCDSYWLLFPLAILTALGVAILFLSHDFRRLIRYSPFRRLLPTVAKRQTAGLLRLLSIPTGIGQPLAATLTAAAQFHPDRRSRLHLLQARTDSVSDIDTWNQLANQKLIARNQAEQLGYIANPSLRAWTLRTLSDRMNIQASQRTESLARVAQHLPVIAIGIFVGWVAIAVMQTLTTLIRWLA